MRLQVRGSTWLFDYLRLHARVRGARALQPGVRTSELPTSAQLRARACAQVRQGDLSRARRTLTSASLTPGDEETLAALSDPDRRPPQPRRPLPPPPSLPAAAIRLDAAAVADALRTAKKGTAAGLSGATVDHYKILLADEATLALFAEAATKLANADVP